MVEQFTPGPWFFCAAGPVIRGYGQSFAVAEQGKPNLIAGCFGDVQGGPERAEANARLIAAAPAMYAALQAIAGAKFNCSHQQMWMAMQAVAEAAIAQAIGETNG